MDWNVQVLLIFSYVFPLGSCVWRSNQDPKVVLIGLLTWKLLGWNIILIKIVHTNKNLSDKSCSHGLKYSTFTNFFLCFATWFMCLRAESRVESCLNRFIDMKIWEWNIILTKIVDTNKNLSDKSCPHGLKSSTLTNFFLCFETWFMCLRAELRLKSSLNRLIEMKTMGMKYFFNQNS